MNQGHSLTVLFLSSNCVSNASSNNEVVKQKKKTTCTATFTTRTSPTYIRILPGERTRILLPIAVSLGYDIRECTTPRIAVHFIFEGPLACAGATGMARSAIVLLANSAAAINLSATPTIKNGYQLGHSCQSIHAHLCTAASWVVY